MTGSCATIAPRFDAISNYQTQSAVRATDRRIVISDSKMQLYDNSLEYSCESLSLRGETPMMSS